VIEDFAAESSTPAVDEVGAAQDSGAGSAEEIEVLPPVVDEGTNER
jgi:hypothetical protein